MAFDITKPAGNDSVGSSAPYIRENFRALLQDKFAQGSTTPSSATGIDGYLFFNTTEKILYEKINGVWTAIVAVDVPDATASTKGKMKLYTSTGNSTDGTMTRNAITNALSGKLDNTASAITTALGSTAVQNATYATSAGSATSATNAGNASYATCATYDAVTGRYYTLSGMSCQTGYIRFSNGIQIIYGTVTVYSEDSTRYNFPVNFTSILGAGIAGNNHFMSGSVTSSYIEIKNEHYSNLGSARFIVLGTWG